MENLIYLLAFLVGTVFGSFFNVVIHRLPEGMSIITPPSMCPQCQQKISPVDNIPIVSFLLLGGKCRHCKNAIPVRYLLVELAGGVIFALSYHFDGMSVMLLRDIIFYSILLLVTFIDLDTRIIPDILSLGGLLAGFFIVTLFLKRGWKFPLIGILVGSGILFFTAFFYELATKREGLGGGDIKLLGMVGAFTGYQGAILTIFIGSVIGTLFGVFLIVRERGDMKTAVPFGPFLAGGAVIADIFLRHFTIRL